MNNPKNGDGGREFDRMATAKSANLFSEVWAFMGHNKKWWLLPLIVVLVLVGALIVLSTTAVAPFIYTLF